MKKFKWAYLFLPLSSRTVGVIPLTKSFIERIPFYSHVIQIDYHTKMLGTCWNTNLLTTLQPSIRSDVELVHNYVCAFIRIWSNFLWCPHYAPSTVLPFHSFMYAIMFSVVRQLAGIMVANLKVKLKKMGDWRGRDIIKSIFSISAIHFVFHAKKQRLVDPLF